MSSIKIAITGVGNCASSLLQGIEYYRTRQRTDEEACRMTEDFIAGTRDD